MKTFLRALLYLLVIAAVVATGLFLAMEIVGVTSIRELYDFVKSQL